MPTALTWSKNKEGIFTSGLRCLDDDGSDRTQGIQRTGAAAAMTGQVATAAAAKGGGGMMSHAAGSKSLIVFVVLALAWCVGFASRLFAVIRFESIIHEYDPW